MRGLVRYWIFLEDEALKKKGMTVSAQQYDVHHKRERTFAR